MRIAVLGKGGAGKTTTAAILARTLARGGHGVVALDCDTNANLGISLGLGEDVTEEVAAVRAALDDAEAEHAPEWEDMVTRFGTSAPDGVRYVVVHKIEDPEPG